MEFRILGPVEARNADETVALASEKQRALLAPSLSTSGETLTIEESMTLRARTENAGHGVEHEWSWSSG